MQKAIRDGGGIFGKSAAVNKRADSMPVGEPINGHRNVGARSRGGRRGLIGQTTEVGTVTGVHDVVVSRTVRQARVGVRGCGRWTRIRNVYVVAAARASAAARCPARNVVGSCSRIGVRT